MNTLPGRAGPRPETTSRLPHSQIDQQPTDPGMRGELAKRAFGLDGVREEPSRISVPGARALISDGHAVGPPSAFLTGREFAHLHPGPDWSLHLALPEDQAQAAIDGGWAEPHYLVSSGEVPPTIVLVYAPRDPAELEVVWHLVQASHRFASLPADTEPDTPGPTGPGWPTAMAALQPARTTGSLTHDEGGPPWNAPT